MEVARDEMARILTALEFTCEPDGDESLRVTAPISRLDVGTGMTGVHDLLEEMARILGYDRIPVTDMAETLPPQRNNLAVEGRAGPRPAGGGRTPGDHLVPPDHT
jgi:phenylalanyl-tRNA synthetase beta chain